MLLVEAGGDDDTSKEGHGSHGRHHRRRLHEVVHNFRCDLPIATSSAPTKTARSGAPHAATTTAVVSIVSQGCSHSSRHHRIALTGHRIVEARGRPPPVDLASTRDSGNKVKARRAVTAVPLGQ